MALSSARDFQIVLNPHLNVLTPIVSSIFYYMYSTYNSMKLICLIIPFLINYNVFRLCDTEVAVDFRTEDF